MIAGLLNQLKHIPPYTAYGQVSALRGLLFEVVGLEGLLAVGNQCKVITSEGKDVYAEVVGFNNTSAQLMAFEDLKGMGPGCRVELLRKRFSIAPSNQWLGRIVDGFGRPLDDGPPLVFGPDQYDIFASAIPAHLRQRCGQRLDLGVRALNTFTTTCRGQRMGIFSGSGVGKSMLMAQITRFTTADINVIGLIGERGREVREFIEDYLTPEALARTVIVVSTSDEPALMRRQAAYTTMTVAEYFRDQGHQVLCFMDSVTRFAMASREIGLSVGEPPATKGYTPSVFAELPRLLERAGPGHKNGTGSITGLFTVLVEGDDENEPISDAVRGILDGHIVLERAIANRNRFPAINVLRSISRLMPDCNTDDETNMINRAKDLMATYDDMSEMIRLGAYRAGSDPKIDEAILYHEPLERFLSQGKNEESHFQDSTNELAKILGYEQKDDQSAEAS